MQPYDYNVQGEYITSSIIKANDFVTIQLPAGIYIAEVQGREIMKFIVS